MTTDGHAAVTPNGQRTLPGAAELIELLVDGLGVAPGDVPVLPATVISGAAELSDPELVALAEVDGAATTSAALALAGPLGLGHPNINMTGSTDRLMRGVYPVALSP
jgi:hypothetical protein